MILDYIIVIVYLGAVLMTGVLSAGEIKSLRDFSLSTKKYSFFPLLATLSASFIGGGFSTGNAAKTAQYGIGNIAALFGFSLSVILVGNFVVPKIKRFISCVSVGEIMGNCYGNVARIITGLFSFAVCAGILGAQVGAMGYMFQVLLGTSQIAGILIGCGVIITYSTFGGMKAVVSADILQVIILGIGIPLLLHFSLKETGGLKNVTDNLPAEFFNPLNGIGFIKFISLFISFALGEALVPPFVQRLLMGNNLKITKKATIVSGIISVPFFIITGMIGLVGAVYFAGQSINMEAVMQSMVKAVVPVGFRGLIIAAMLSVLMSSSDSFLNSASVALVNDVLVPACKNRLSEKVRLYAVYICSVLTGVFSVATAALIPNVLDVLTFAYSFWSPVILVPLAATLMGHCLKKHTFYACMLCGFTATILWTYIWNNPLGIDGAIVGAAANFAAMKLFETKVQVFYSKRTNKI